jgi:N-acylglucosamine-6-phosphate 2-epimerase
VSASVVEQLRGGLVVSCQAPPGHPLREPDVIGLMAECAQLGGAAGLRVNGAEDIKAAQLRTSLPIIGLHKVRASTSRDYITPGLEYATELAAAGAAVIALEATGEVPGEPLSLLAQVRCELGLPAMADVSTLDEGLQAWDAGADLVGTTLSGYTAASRADGVDSDDAGPDLRLVEALTAHGVRTIAEGRYATVPQIEQAFAAGAWAVVVGTAITDPVAITRRLASATPLARSRR